MLLTVHRSSIHFQFSTGLPFFQSVQHRSSSVNVLLDFSASSIILAPESPTSLPIHFFTYPLPLILFPLFISSPRDSVWSMNYFVSMFHLSFLLQNPQYSYLIILSPLSLHSLYLSIVFFFHNHPATVWLNCNYNSTFRLSFPLLNLQYCYLFSYVFISFHS